MCARSHVRAAVRLSSWYRRLKTSRADSVLAVRHDSGFNYSLLLQYEFILVALRVSTFHRLSLRAPLWNVYSLNIVTCTYVQKRFCGPRRVLSSFGFGLRLERPYLGLSRHWVCLLLKSRLSSVVTLPLRSCRVHL